MEKIEDESLEAINLSRTYWKDSLGHTKGPIDSVVGKKAGGASAHTELWPHGCQGQMCSMCIAELWGMLSIPRIVGVKVQHAAVIDKGHVSHMGLHGLSPSTSEPRVGWGAFLFSGSLTLNYGTLMVAWVWAGCLY